MFFVVLSSNVWEVLLNRTDRGLVPRLGYGLSRAVDWFYGERVAEGLIVGAIHPG